MKTVLILILLTGSAMADPQQPAVKLSRSGICHGVDSPWYAKVSNFKAFKTMADCLAVEGTREPKRKKKKAKGGAS